MLPVLQISATVLISLSGIFFACAEGSPLAGVTPLVALFALYFVDRKGIIQIPPGLAALLGVVAFLAAGAEFASGHVEARLLAGGHLIVYLSWIFLVQQKDSPRYWWLCALSILQMAVASVLTSAVWFGAALLLYVFAASWTLSVFLLYRSVRGSVADAGGDVGRVSRKHPPGQVVGDSWRGISRDVDQRLLNWRFAGSTLTVTCLALVLSVLFFLFTPRIWIGHYSIFGDGASPGRPLTGFTEEVRLGDLGEILENSDPVLEMKLFHGRSQSEFTQEETLSYLGTEPLLRGAVLEEYHRGRWNRSEVGERERVWRSRRRGRILQRITLQPIGTPTLFGFGNILSARARHSDEALQRKPFTNEFFRSEPDRSGEPFEYVVDAEEGSPDASSARDRSRWEFYRRLEFEQYQLTLRHLPGDLDRVRALTLDLTRDSRSPEEKAERIQAYLRDSGEFTYSLKLNVQDPTVDPVEDFLFNRKEGHCEYYASAMALMLRSADIPARIVSGFKGGRYDRRKGAYVVQQLHAHAWVEAYIHSHGRWRTYDPTPGGREESVAAIEAGASSWNAWKNSIRNYWDFGIRMSRQQQHRAIYQPIAESARTTWEVAKEVVQGKQERFATLAGFFKSPRRWISWQGGLVAFSLLLLASGMAWVLRKIVAAGSPWFSHRRRAGEKRQRVEFYERFLRILGTQRIHQAPTQTAREFVRQSLDEFEELFTRNGLDAWPDELVESFYRVRFGGLHLTAAEAAEVDRRLGQLEACLSNGETSSK